VVGDQAVIMYSSDGGSTWAASSIPTGVAGIESIACPTATRCIGVGSLVIVSNDDGLTWQTVGVSGGVIQLFSIACASSTQCVAVGPNPAGLSNPNAQGDGVETTDGGTTFAKVALPAASASLFDVSCSLAASCVAAGATGTGASAPTFLGSATGGTSWTNQAPPPGFSAISGLACSSSTACVAVGRTSSGPSLATSNSSGQWSVAPPGTTAPIFGSTAT
jgi:photosystem II stability/assembly factor-like uncharacterized protein